MSLIFAISICGENNLYLKKKLKHLIPGEKKSEDSLVECPYSHAHILAVTEQTNDSPTAIMSFTQHLNNCLKYLKAFEAIPLKVCILSRAKPIVS